jgi:hypothetical protein
MRLTPLNISLKMPPTETGEQVAQTRSSSRGPNNDEKKVRHPSAPEEYSGINHRTSSHATNLTAVTGHTMMCFHADDNEFYWSKTGFQNQCQQWPCWQDMNLPLCLQGSLHCEAIKSPATRKNMQLPSVLPTG